MSDNTFFETYLRREIKLHDELEEDSIKNNRKIYAEICRQKAALLRSLYEVYKDTC